jgi:DHA3 family tetracycline resistance protein-like MFS transporter
MLGRVSSLDWLISIGLLPLSMALTAPVAAAIGTRATLVGAGVAGAVVTLAALFLPGMRNVEREPELPAGSAAAGPDPAADAVNVLIETLQPRSASDTRR